LQRPTTDIEELQIGISSVNQIMKRIRQKQLTEDDLHDLEVCITALSAIPNVGRATSPSRIDGLYANGSAQIVIPINPSIANGIWEMMGTPKDDEKSAYRDVMAAERLTLTANLFKGGTLFRTVYVAHVNISCWGTKIFKVEFGTVASKRIALLIHRLVLLLKFEKPIALSTDEALAAMDHS
jgi:hypothetical protein